MRKLLIALVLLGGVVWLVTSNSSKTEEQPPAQDQQQTEQTAQSETKGTSTDEASKSPFQYIAQRGDSYPKMARKAMQAYAKKHELNITQAGIIFAETNLTKLASSPQLAVGQEVTFTEEILKEWADKAVALTDAQQKAWGRYVPGVNFDTSRVGEVPSH